MFRIPALPLEFSGDGQPASGLVPMSMPVPMPMPMPMPWQVAGPMAVPFPLQQHFPREPPNSVPAPTPAPAPAVAPAVAEGEKKKRGRPKKVSEEVEEDLRCTRLTRALTQAQIVKTSTEATRWLTLCMPDGAKLPPYAVGIRKDPADPSGQATVGTPLYMARDVFDHVIDPALQRTAKWKRWQRLWKSSTGQDGPLVEHSVYIQEDGTCAASCSPRPDALVGFNGLEVLIDSVGSESLTRRPRDFFFFQTPPFDATPARQNRPKLSSHSTVPQNSVQAVPPAHHAVSADELVREAIELLRTGIEQGSSQGSSQGLQATLEQSIDELRLQPDRAASLREIASFFVSACSAPASSRASDGLPAASEAGSGVPF